MSPVPVKTFVGHSAPIPEGHVHRDPFGREMQVPVGLDRAGRIRLLRECADALLRGEVPSLPAALFVGGAVVAWLAQGGRLSRDYLMVDAPRGSHFRPEVLARRLLIDDERQADADPAESGDSTSGS